MPHPAAPVAVRVPREVRGGLIETMLGTVLLLFLALFQIVQAMTARVGVTTRTETRSGPAPTPRSPGSTYFVVGLTERGPTDEAVRVTSMAEYRAIFGDRFAAGYVYDDLTSFFEDGGSRAWVARGVGAAADVATTTLNDDAGAPAPTLRLDAVDEGEWGNEVTREVLAGPVANSRVIVLRYRGQEERFTITSPADAVTKLELSKWVRGTDLGSVTVAPNNLPAVTAEAALAGGTDNRAAVTAVTLTDLLDDRFPRELGDGFVTVPGYHADDVAEALDAHATANERIWAAHVGEDETRQDALAAAAEYNTDAGGILYPWPLIREGRTLRRIPPTGYAAAARARAHDLEGPWRAPIGELTASDYLAGLADDVGVDDARDLDAGRVSVLRRVGSSIRLYGWRSLSLDEENYALLNQRDLLNRIEVGARDILERFVGETIDGEGRLLARINGELRGFLAPMARAGGLYARYDGDGNLLDPGYSVTTSPEVNTPGVLAANRVHATLTVRPSPTAAEIDLTITKAGFLAAV